MLTGLLEAAVVLGVFVWALRPGDLARARSLAFSTLVFGELFRAFAARSPTRVFWEVGVVHQRAAAWPWSSSRRWCSSGSITSRGCELLFRIQDLPLETRVIPFLLALIPVTALEVRKLLRRPA